MKQFSLLTPAKRRILRQYSLVTGIPTITQESLSEQYAELEQKATEAWAGQGNKFLPVDFEINSSFTLSDRPELIRAYKDDFKEEDSGTGVPQIDSSWVMQIPVISTQHIPKELAEWLREHEFGDDVVDMLMGWMICVHTNIDYVDLDPWGAMERLKQFMKLNYPELIADGLAWIRFDVDGDEYVGLEDYDW